MSEPVVLGFQESLPAHIQLAKDKSLHELDQEAMFGGFPQETENGDDQEEQQEGDQEEGGEEGNAEGTGSAEGSEDPAGGERALAEDGTGGDEAHREDAGLTPPVAAATPAPAPAADTSALLAQIQLQQQALMQLVLQQEQAKVQAQQQQFAAAQREARAAQERAYEEGFFANAKAAGLDPDDPQVQAVYLLSKEIREVRAQLAEQNQKLQEENQQRQIQEQSRRYLENLSAQAENFFKDYSMDQDLKNHLIKQAYNIAATQRISDPAEALKAAVAPLASVLRKQAKPATPVSKKPPEKVNRLVAARGTGAGEKGARRSMKDLSIAEIERRMGAGKFG